jgi:DNA-binding response OmpR family regulator
MHRCNGTDGIIQRLNQLAAAHSEAESLLREIVSKLCEEFDFDVRSIAASNRRADGSSPARSVQQVPLADPNTLAIHWKGKTCFLGKTLAFKFFARLARRPNQFLSHDLLLDEVWECRVTKEAIRSVVKTLKQKLRKAGMDDLAARIDGGRRECYGLILDRGI